MSQPSTCFHPRNIDHKKRHFLTFKVFENDGNGDCLFLSIIQFLKHDENHEIPNNAMALRQQIVNYISHSSNWNRFVDTIIFNLENVLPILQKKDYSDRFKMRIYSNYMSQECQFGTFAELQAASEIFNFVYVVFRKDSRGSDEANSSNESSETRYNCYSSEDHKLKSKMFLLFSGTPSSGHFQFMKPIFPGYISVVPQGEYKEVDEFHGSDNSLILSVKKIAAASSSACPLCGNYK